MAISATVPTGCTGPDTGPCHYHLSQTGLEKWVKSSSRTPIVIVPPFGRVQLLVHERCKHAISSLGGCISLPSLIESHARVSWWIAIERTKRTKPGHEGDRKGAKLRYRHLSYRWFADIVILPPFCPDLFLQNPKLGFTSRTQVVIMSISIFGDICYLLWVSILLLVTKSKSPKKVAKMRFQHLSYRWLSDIAFLPPFCEISIRWPKVSSAFMIYDENHRIYL